MAASLRLPTCAASFRPVSNRASLGGRYITHLPQRQVSTRSWSELVAAAGDVQAPVTVPIVAAVVVTAVATFIVPAYLNRGQQAADKIFASKKKAPLDTKRKQTGKGGAKRR